MDGDAPFLRVWKSLRGQEKGCQVEPLEGTKLSLLTELSTCGEELELLACNYILHGCEDRGREIPTMLILIPQA